MLWRCCETGEGDPMVFWGLDPDGEKLEDCEESEGMNGK